MDLLLKPFSVLYRLHSLPPRQIFHHSQVLQASGGVIASFISCHCSLLTTSDSVWLLMFIPMFENRGASVRTTSSGPTSPLDDTEIKFLVSSTTPFTARADLANAIGATAE